MWLMIVGACALDPTYPPLQPLFHQLDSRLPRGDYRIPSLVSTLNGTLLAFVAGREHRTDYTPNIIYLRRSQDDGATWTEAVPVLEDPTNCTEFDVTPVVDASDGRIHLIHHRLPWCGHHMGCPKCLLWDAVSSDDGATWGAAAPLTTVGPANTTWGNGLASGISLTRGPHAGRLLVALRHDCGCGDKRASFVVYSDDHGASWQGGKELLLLPQYGGGWTECEVAELRNGSVLLTSRNFYGESSGYGPRLFARSDDGGQTWAANWSAGAQLPDPYCEGSMVGDAASGTLYFANPSNSRHRANFSIHGSLDGGSTWPLSQVVYPGGGAYSDMAFTRNGSVAVLFEKDNYNTVAFGVVPLPLQTSRIRSPSSPPPATGTPPMATL